MRKTGYNLLYKLFTRSEQHYYLTEVLPEAIRTANPLFKYWDRHMTRDHNKTNDMVMLLNEVLSQESD